MRNAQVLHENLCFASHLEGSFSSCQLLRRFAFGSGALPRNLRSEGSDSPWDLYGVGDIIGLNRHVAANDILFLDKWTAVDDLLFN